MNNFLYKFRFNSYNLNGLTVTNIVIFITQAICMLIWKGNEVKGTWIVGVIFIIIGVVILEKNKNKYDKANTMLK